MNDSTTQQYVTSDGTVLTDELVEELAAEAENGFSNSTVTPVAGRPWETMARPRSTAFCHVTTRR